MKSRIQKFIERMRKNKTSAWLFVAYALVFIIAFVIAQQFLFGGDTNFQFIDRGEPAADTEVTEELIERHPLTGQLIPEEVELPQVIAVMIDDHEFAHPQAGLDEAFLVIEAPVEANIPRIEAFFYEGQEAIEEIGPVRSARPYYLEWAQELDAMYVHVGGSPEALEHIVVRDIFDFNQFWNGNFFWRGTDRPAPHNVFTSLEMLTEGLEVKREAGKAPERLIYGSWKFKDAEEKEDDLVESIGIEYLMPTYSVEWDFDSERVAYKRSFSAEDDTLRNGNGLWADNVAIVITDIEIIDRVGRRKLRTNGEGKAIVFQDGVMIEGTWGKVSESQRLRFFDEEGEEIVMNAGMTWIQVVGDEEDVEIK